ncbi:hypothetical protein [Microbulbifer sediminum]|uniref:hypothetical protein n=1 Tax=Microbulbifer sediminum TaxID=2904250 RepID=UPI001F1D2DBD|nr:hypothetical protein [Microbulbifer sediminum]
MHLNEWIQKGRVYIWTYEGNPKSYRGWHLTCDKDGAESLAHLVAAIADADMGKRRTVKLTRPSDAQLLVPNCKFKHHSFDKLVVSHGSAWLIESDAERVVLSIPSELAESLKARISGIPRGKGDISMGIPGSELWFWW